MTIAARAYWCVHIVGHDEAERLGTVQAQTYREAYREAARQFGVSPERQSRLFVRPIGPRVRLKARPVDAARQRGRHLKARTVTPIER
jgi:hypothetical protein